MEDKAENKSYKQQVIIVILAAFSAIVSFGLVYQQFQLQDLQSDLESAKAVIASQNYQSGLTWERLLCAEKQGISPDEVFAAHRIDENNGAVTVKLQCGASTIEDVKKYELIEADDNKS